MRASSRGLLVIAVVAATLTAGCLNSFFGDEPVAPSSDYLIRVLAVNAEPEGMFNLSREDIQDLLVAGSATTELNGLVQILDEVSTGLYRENGRFVRVGRTAWITAQERVHDVCLERAGECADYQFVITWRGTPIRLTFERSFG